MLENSAAQVPHRKKCTVYVDGFNWYWSLFRHYPAWKWLNIQSFFESLRIDDDIIAVKLFTALVDPHWTKSNKRDRQTTYLSALETLSKMQIIYGKYQDREVTCRAKCQEKYYVPEEKKSDVNVAVHLLNDAVKGLTETMVIVSGDSDLEPAVTWVRENYPKIKIVVYIPSLPEEERHRQNFYYSTIGVFCKFLPLPDIVKHQLPPKLFLGNGKMVMRPPEWA